MDLGSQSSTTAVLDEAQTMQRCKDVVDTYVKGLHAFNETKDAAQGLVGMLAEMRGIRVMDVMVDFGMGTDEDGDGNGDAGGGE